MRTLPTLCIGLLLLLTSSISFAANPIDEQFLTTFINTYSNDPTALQRFQEQLKYATPEHIDHVITKLDTDNYTYLAPVVVKAQQLEAAQHLAIDELALMAVRNGKLEHIPFQIDEFDRHGFVWVDGVNKEAAEGKPAYFDGFDELVFMFRDASTERLDAQPQHPVVAQLSLTAPNQQQRYAYLVKTKAPTADFKYVYTDLRKGKIKSAVFEVGFNPKNLLDLQHITPAIGPQADQNLLKNFNIHLSTGLLNRHVRFNLQLPNNIRALPLAVREGQIRSTILMRARVWYLGIPTLLTQNMQVHIYEQGTAVPVPFNISSIGALRHFVALLKEPKLELHMEINHAQGASVAFENLYTHHGQTATVSGHNSALKEQFNQQRMPGDWLSVDSNQGWSLLFANGIPIREHGLFDHYLAGTELKMLYEENKQGGLKIGFEGTHLPEIIFQLMKTAPKLPPNVDELGTALVFYEQEGRKGALANYDKVVNAIVQSFTEDKNTLINAFLQDMERMEYTGIAADTLRDIITDALHDSIAIPQDSLDHSAILTAMLAQTHQRNERLKNLRFATIPMNLWFPHSLQGAPDTFFSRQQEGIRVQTQAW